jgi:hypothetical protein
MDKATLIGLVMGIGAVVGGQVLEEGNLHSIIQITKYAKKPGKKGFYLWRRRSRIFGTPF